MGLPRVWVGRTHNLKSTKVGKKESSILCPWTGGGGDEPTPKQRQGWAWQQRSPGIKNPSRPNRRKGGVMNHPKCQER